MTRILTILRTPGAMLFALVLALVAQLEHTAQVFSMVVDATGIGAQLHAYAFAIAVETAVLLFVLAGHRWISYGFAGATALTNLSYYAMCGVVLFSVQGLPAWLMSLLLPAAIMGYSHTIAEQDDKAPTMHQDTLHTPVAVSGVTTGHSEQLPTITEATDNAQYMESASVHLEQSSSNVEPTQSAKKPRKRTVRKTAKPSAAQRRAQIVSAGLDSAAQVVAQFGVGLRTAQADLSAIKNANGTNGVH